jgi:ribosomal protein L9
VQMPTGPIKMIGESSVKLALHTDVEAEIKVVVIPEKE